MNQSCFRMATVIAAGVALGFYNSLLPVHFLGLKVPGLNLGHSTFV